MWLLFDKAVCLRPETRSLLVGLSLLLLLLQRTGVVCATVMTACSKL